MSLIKKADVKNHICARHRTEIHHDSVAVESTGQNACAEIPLFTRYSQISKDRMFACSGESPGCSAPKPLTSAET